MTTFEQREHQQTDHRDGHSRHRGGYADLWGQERQRENDGRGHHGRHRMDDHFDLHTPTDRSEAGAMAASPDARAVAIMRQALARWLREVEPPESEEQHEPRSGDDD